MCADDDAAPAPLSTHQLGISRIHSERDPFRRASLRRDVNLIYQLAKGMEKKLAAWDARRRFVNPLATLYSEK
jgi:hypothetical protein